jgi:hypothetical protein
MIYAVKMALCGTHDIHVRAYIPSIMKIGTSVQAILRLCLRNLRGCDAGMTDGRDS